MSWNLRVIKNNETGWFGIYEVYYDQDGKPSSWTEEPVCPAGEDYDELLSDIDHFNAAMKKPALQIVKDGDKLVLKEI
jgi:hypothetical protein